jgi:hypothetical protein
MGGHVLRARLSITWCQWSEHRWRRWYRENRSQLSGKVDRCRLLPLLTCLRILLLCLLGFRLGIALVLLLEFAAESGFEFPHGGLTCPDNLSNIHKTGFS